MKCFFAERVARHGGVTIPGVFPKHVDVSLEAVG